MRPVGAPPAHESRLLSHAAVDAFTAFTRAEAGMVPRGADEREIDFVRRRLDEVGDEMSRQRALWRRDGMAEAQEWYWALRDIYGPLKKRLNELLFEEYLAEMRGR